MSRQDVPLKDPFIAAILGFLIPGLGHLYQRRMFKAAIYSVCILGTFYLGMYLGDWKVVYVDMQPKTRRWPYLCQVWTGLPALPAMWQYKRSKNNPDQLMVSVSGEFRGVLDSTGTDLDGKPVVGKLTLDPAADIGFNGDISGTIDGELPFQGTVSGSIIDRRIAPSFERRLDCEIDVTLQQDGEEVSLHGSLKGGLKRRVSEWYAAPLKTGSDDSELQKVNGRLGRYFELGTVFTMIAGLLNILAIYDAFEGPAYGRGDDDDENSGEDSTPEAKS